jgi:chromosome segregation ATPase
MESELKEKFLELLDKDKEFRYAVAAYLGLADILRRLDRFEEIQTKILEEIREMRIEQNKLWENQNKMWEEIKGLRENQEKLWESQNKMWENQNKILEEIKYLRENQERLWENQNKMWEEIKALRENQEKLWENQNKLWENQNKILEEIKGLREGQQKLWENQNKIWEEIKGLRENQERLWENQNKMWEEIKNLRENQEKLWENQNKIWEEINKTWKEIKSLREEQTKIWKEIKAIQQEQRRLSITVERLTISVEEEARDVISYRLSKELGIEIKLDRLFINDREINIYGAVGDICVIGEASVRVGPRIVREIEEKIELIRKYKLELLKPKLIKVIYADVVPPKVLELASKNNIWVLSWKGDLLPMKIIQ